MADSPEVRFDVIAAMDRNSGIGKDYVLPWSIPSEFDYFHRMTRNPRPGPSGEARRNAVIIGRRTWETMDRLTQRPYPGALNIVLSRAQIPDVIGFEDTVVCESLDLVVTLIQQEPNIDQVWVFGGAQVYQATIRSHHFHRLYLTRIDAEFDCDSYFPEDALAGLRRLTADETSDDRVPTGRQVDPTTGVAYEVFVYERSEPVSPLT